MRMSAIGTKQTYRDRLQFVRFRDEADMRDGAVLTASVDNATLYSIGMTGPAIPKAVLFDQLTALLDSASLWNAVAGSDEKGRAWRAEYLRLTYGCGAYRPYEQLVREAADATAIEDSATEALVSRWGELSPWSGAQTLLDKLQDVTKLAVVTNCSERLGVLAASRLGTRWDCIVTAERAGY